VKNFQRLPSLLRQTSPQEVQALLKHIGVDGIRYEEFFITSFDGDVLGLYDYLGEYENLDCFEFYPDIETEEDLGRYWAEDLPIPAELKDYFDYGAYGRDISINEGGHFAPGGYIVQTSGDFKEDYHDTKDIPAGHKVFSFPQLSIREQMAAYKKVIDGSSKEGFRRLTEKSREER
jgi:hypothetical protein